MSDNPNTFDIQHSNVQILPNAKYAVQNFYGVDYAKKVLSNRPSNKEYAVSSTVLDMYYYSDTKPEAVSNEIMRRQILDLCEKRLTSDNVFCLYGEEGFGVTTVLAQFAKTHSQNCVSYFYNGLDIMLMDADIMENSIAEQLFWYANGAEGLFDSAHAEKANITGLWASVYRKIKRSNQPLYFVFDGFDNIPAEKEESVKHFLEKLFWDNGRFIFSGKKEAILKIIPSNSKLSISDYEIVPFGEAEVKEYFRQSVPDASATDLQALYDITRGIGYRMETVLHSHVEKGMLKELLESNTSGTSDLYDYDFQRIFQGNDPLTLDFFALLTYTEFPLQVPVATAILSVTEKDFLELTERFKDYVQLDEEGICTLLKEGFHKYLRRKLKSLKQEMELKILSVLQKPEYMMSHCSFIPPLMKTLHQTDQLVTFLSRDNIQNILVSKQSQAALNEQCEFGFEACKSEPEKYAATLFRFALNKSVSREIEKNELWDNELEALLATGHTEQALALSRDVYLAEERLKSFLLIARKKKLLRPSDYEILKENIHQLVTNIQFEKIPDKAIELAKLLLPIDYESAIAIVDKVAKANKQTVNADRVYTLMSLMNNKTDAEAGNVTNFDMVSAKIEDDELRTFTHAAKNLFADVSVDRFLEELSKLPSNSRKLHLLQIWLPEHEEKEDIGKAVLQAIQLIVAVSDTDMPKARILNTVCHSMSKMTLEEMKKAMSYVESLTETIKYPTFDYVDAELTIIEATKDVLPKSSREHLEDLYLYICDLDDESVRISCLSKLLGRFDYLGKRAETEKTLGCYTGDLRRDIIDGVRHLLQETAYHLKVVEEPIKALVCDYSSMIDELIDKINTTERKKRAYSLAASQYLLNQDEEKVKPEKLFELIGKTDNTFSNRENPLDLLSRMLYYAKHADHAAFLPVLKSHFLYFEELERPARKVIIFMRLYLWMREHFPDDTFADKVKTHLLDIWHSIEATKARIECGFFLAKNFAKVSSDDAEDILAKCRQMKTECFLASSSCVTAYDIAMELYTRSMGLLIRYGMCEDDTLIKQFADDIDTQLSVGERATLWSNVALEYLLANDNSQFCDLCNKYIPAHFDFCSVHDQKCIIWAISPAMFYYSRDTLYNLLSHYDEQFMNDCLKNVTEFIFCKEAFLSGVSTEFMAYPLEYKDYQDLIAVLEHATNDDILFHVVSIIAKSLREGKPKRALSTEQKDTVVKEIERIVKDKLPSREGIQHDGYKIACLAALRHSKTEFFNKDRAEWLDAIEKIDNLADKSFLYLQTAPYFQKKNDKQEFFQKGINVAESISSSFDKVNRLDMSINECMENNLSGLVKPVAETALRSLRINGTLEDYKQFIDVVYQHKPELAEEMVNNFDSDPARAQYKKRLLTHISSAKKLAQAHEKLDTVDNLNRKEQVKFFSKQLDNLLNGKGQVLEIDRLFALSINHIYDHTIDDAKYAIHYIMEDVFRKYNQSRQNKALLLNIHNALRYNLLLVLSLAADTRDRIERVESLICTRDVNDEGYIQIGEEKKAKAYILNWYQSYNYDTLTIIDPYFKPQDLHIIKPLCDINNDLEIKILCHRQKFQNEDYVTYWRSISSGVTNTIRLNFVWYDDNPMDGPLHDRYWVCSNEEDDKHQGITLCSVDSLGKKESSIVDIKPEAIPAILLSFTKYAYSHIGKIRGRKLRYDEMELE